jgi:outer membrane protein assembly factor BamB
MKHLILSILTILVLASPSCKKDMPGPSTNSEGQVNYLPSLWEYSLHKDGKFHSNSIIDANLVFNGKVLVGTTEGEGDNWLNAVDIETGTELWKWNDIYQPPTEKMDIGFFYREDNIMAYIVGSRHYAIDLETGQTFWKIKREESFDNEMEGLGSTYFIMGQPMDTLLGYDTQVVFKGNIGTGEIERILVPDFLTDYVQAGKLGSVTSVIPFVENNDTMLLVGWQDVYPDFELVSYLGLYNLTQQEWVYERAKLNEPVWDGALLQPITIYEGKAYMNVGHDLICHDVWTGERIWKHSFTRDFLFSGFLVEDGRVIANCEDKVLYCYDADSGALIWKGEGAGTSSPLKDRYLNEVVYFSGGSSGLIHAVDARNGETLWKLDPTKMGDGSDFWKPDLYVVPGKNGEKGKVIALTPMKAYCFEAYR